MQNPIPHETTPCPACASAPASTAACFACGRIAAERRSPRALQLAAVDGLVLDLGRRPYLPDDLRQELLGRLEQARAVLRPAIAKIVRPLPVARAVAGADFGAADKPFVPAPDRIAAARQAARAVAPIPQPVTAGEDVTADAPADARASAPPRSILPDWLSRLGPAAAENLMYLLGGFLVVAGAIYFASTAWTTMTGTQRLLLLDGGLLGLGGLLVGVGRLLTRRFAHESAGRRIRGITAHIAAGLGPLAAIIAGRAALDAPLLGLAALAAVTAATVGARRLADGPGQLRSAATAQGVTLLAAAAPLVAAWPIAGALLGGLLTGVAARSGLRSPRGSDLGHVAGAAFALAAHLILCTGAFGAGTVTLAALAAGLVLHVESRAGRLAVLALGLVALGPAFTLPELLPVVGALATWTAARVALDLDRAPLLGLPLATSLLTYVTAREPLRDLVFQLKAAFSASMGYGDAPLPLAWYGVTCLPYVLALAWVTHRLRDRPSMARMSTGWLLLVTLGLCALSVVSYDPRAPMAVLAADGLALLVIGLGLRQRIFVVLAPLALMGSALAASFWLGSSPAGSLLLMEVLVGVAVLAALPIARPRELHRPLLWTAGLPLLAVGLALVPFESGALLLPALAVLVAGTLLRAHHTGNPIWIGAAAALLVGLVPPTLALLGVAERHELWIGGLALVALAEGTRRLRRRPRRAHGARMALPLTMTMALGWLAAGLNDVPPPMTGLALTLLWAHAAWRLRVAEAAPVAVLLAAATAAWAASVASMGPQFGEPQFWGPLAAAAVGLTATLLARRNTPWLRRIRAGLVEAGIGALLLAGIAAFDGALRGDPLGALIVLGLLLAACLLAPTTRATRTVHRLGLLVPIAAAIATGDLHHALIAPLLYAGLAGFRRVGRPLLPQADRSAAGLLLGSAALLGPALVVHGLFDAPIEACVAAALLIALSATALRRHPRAATAVITVLAALTLWGPAVLALGWVRIDDVPLLWPATGLLLAVGAHHVGLHRGTARAVAGLIAIGTGAALLPWVTHGVVGLSHPLPHGLDPLHTTIYAGLWGATTLAILPARLRRPAAGLVAIPLVVLWPVLSGLIAPGAAPALELALLALAVGGRSVSLVLATLALLATGHPRSLLFAITLTALTALPLRAAGRRDRALGVELTVYALFAAATAWLIALVPSSGRGPAEILPIIGCIAAALAAAVHGAGQRVFERLGLDHTSSGRSLRRPVLILGAIALATITVNIGLMVPTIAPDIVLGGGLLALTLLFACAVHHARRAQSRTAVDAALLMVALGHLFLAARSPWLAPLDGMHLLLWAAAAPVLRVFGGVTELSVRLRSRALLLPIPALVVTLPDHADSAIALLLAAITWGLAARQSGRAAFTWTGLALLLASACRMGLSMDIIDPAFYGLPAGLMLIVGAWLERETLSERAVEALQVAGVIIADLSVAVQVVRLDEPAHALLLFALGLASVAIGWVRKRGDLMLVGAIAVVVDVTLHLLRTGFARGFLAAALLVGAGAVVLIVAGHHTRRRART